MSNESTGRHQNTGACTPEKVAELVAQGHGRNQIARLLEVPVYRVNKAAHAAGVKFDRSATKAATAARMADAQAERAELADKFRQVSQTILNVVLNSDPGDLAPDALRDLLWSAGSAAASDARYGKLILEHEMSRITEEHQSEAAEQFAELLNTVRAGFQTLEDTPLEDLEGAEDDDAAEPP